MAVQWPWTDPESMNNTSEATSIVAPLWKRKWLIIAVAILVAGGTYAYYKRKSPIFLTSTQLYLGNGSEEQGLLNGGSGGKRATSMRANWSRECAPDDKLRESNPFLSQKQQTGLLRPLHCSQ